MELDSDDAEIPWYLESNTPAKTADSDDSFRNRSKKTVDFRNDYRCPDDSSLSVPLSARKHIKYACPCDRVLRRKCFTKRFPVWRIMRKYKWRRDLPNDIVAGLTVGIMQIPQGMAYALLAELPPVVGLYMAFFPVLVYFLFGTSKHISMGTVALCSLLTGSVISRFYDPTLAATVMGFNATKSLTDNVTASDLSVLTEVDLPNDVKLVIASSICLLVGLIQLVMGIFRMGFITTYMSDPMIGGFTTGVAVHVATIQANYVFGLHIPRSDGVFQIVKTYSMIFHNITETNVPTFIMSMACMLIIYIIEVQVNQRFKARLKIPVPVELFVVVGGTMMSYFLNFSERYKMKIIGDIPAGMPMLSIPSLPSTSVYTADVFIIAIVAFSQCVGLAALMAKKHGYSYDANQELIAYGLGNILGSLFSCYPYAASESRTSVQESAGGKTQVASVVSATLVLIVAVSIGPLFQYLPNCVLASIITVALRSLFLQFLSLPKMYRTSVYDFLIWMVTFLSVVILHIDYGLLLGMLFSSFTVVIRSQRTKVDDLEKIVDVQLYESSSKYKTTSSVPGLKVIGYNSPLYYANGSLFTKQVYALSGVTPEKRKRQLKRMAKAGGRASVVSRTSTVPLFADSDEGLEHIVLDLSRVTFIDSAGASVLKQLVVDYGEVEMEVLLCNINDEVWRVLETTEFIKLYEDRLYLTVDDAINAVSLENQITQDSFLKLQQRMMGDNNNADEVTIEDSDSLAAERESSI